MIYILIILVLVIFAAIVWWSSGQPPRQPKSYFRPVGVPIKPDAGSTSDQELPVRPQGSVFHARERQVGTVCFLTGMQRLLCTCDECASTHRNGAPR